MIDGFYYTAEEQEQTEALDDFIYNNSDFDFYDLWSYNDIVELAKAKIDDGMMNVAIHLLEAVYGNEAEYYKYDATSGTLDEPQPIDSIDDLAEAYNIDLEEQEEENA